MNALLLAAGYATRLYPLTRDTPKPLLPVAGRPIAAYMVEQLAAIPEIERLLVVTNARFAPHFQRWAAGQPTRHRVEVVDDGTTTNETRLGAIGDVAFTLRRHPELGADPLFVLGGDNLVDFRLADLVGAYQERNGAPPASPGAGGADRPGAGERPGAAAPLGRGHPGRQRARHRLRGEAGQPPLGPHLPPLLRLPPGGPGAVPPVLAGRGVGGRPGELHRLAAPALPRLRARLRRPPLRRGHAEVLRRRLPASSRPAPGSAEGPRPAPPASAGTPAPPHRRHRRPAPPAPPSPLAPRLNRGATNSPLA